MNAGVDLKPVLILSNKNDFQLDIKSRMSGFEFFCFNAIDKLKEHLHEDFDGLVLCYMGEGITCASCCELRKYKRNLAFPLLAIVEDEKNAVALLKSGCTDIEKRTASEAQLFSKIAALISADEHSSEKSGLGVAEGEVPVEIRNIELNIRFLIDSNECETLVRLGECLSSTLASYSQSFTVQMRGQFEEKLFYLNGLENKLDLFIFNELCETGRFIELGKSCLINYGPLSLLIKDMPEVTDSRYTMIQESSLSLLQGATSRLKFLDAREVMRTEHKLSSELIKKMKLLKEMLEVSR